MNQLTLQSAGAFVVKVGLVLCGVMGFSSIASAYYETTAVIGSSVREGTTTPGDVSYTTNEGLNSGSVIFTASPIASVITSTTSASSVGASGLSSFGQMLYSFEVKANPSTLVPIGFFGLYSFLTSSSGIGNSDLGASVNFSIASANSNPNSSTYFRSNFYGDCGRSTCLQFDTFSNTTYTSTQSDASHAAGTFQGLLDILTGEDGTATGMVVLSASAGATVNFMRASAEAFIDPHLEIDATFLAANPRATLTITPGVGNAVGNTVSAVPEPSTYALMIAGLAMAGFATRRNPLDSTRQGRFSNSFM